MESNFTIKQAAATSAFLLAGLLVVSYFAGMGAQFLVFLGVWAVIILAALAMPHVSYKQISVSAMYILLASTFLNQTLLSIKVGFFTLFLYRLILIAAAFIFMVHVARDRELPRYWSGVQVKGVMLFLLFWLAYGGVSLLWAKSVVDGIKYLFLLGIGVVFVFLAVFTFTSINRLLMVYAIWMLMTVFLMIIGLVNHFFDFQLPTSTLYGGPQYKLSYPTSVFFNQNDFATFLTLSFFFYLAAAKNSTHASVKTISIMLAFLAVYLIYLTESRASLLAVIAGLGVYFFLILPRGLKKITGCLGAAVATLAIFMMFSKFEKLFSLLFSPSGYQARYEALPSNEARLNLLKNTMHYLGESFGFGVGAGNISFYLKNEPVFHTNYVVEVHNWLAEILGNFGLIVFLGYAVMYLYLFFSLFKMYGTGGRKEKTLIEASMLAMVAFLVSSISPSTMINLYFHWVFLGFVISVVSVMNTAGTVPNPRKWGQSPYKNIV
ncbi:teichuronic acid biosynthesis protein TuaE [Peribacillus deserti]|uniref:Teichuronic acid biosynthesis protein TuaE n=1 Tax=Peribacillus deserti TaxID=673318 RepID=A0ABS2QCB9_9BACI|nr:O-antigen ligase family protein [Peribacillus deserti]MBM7690812.1 teichuronic acid biosynthesis protein TuaE [Peribacillus deserti]